MATLMQALLACAGIMVTGLTFFGFVFLCLVAIYRVARWVLAGLPR